MGPSPEKITPMPRRDDGGHHDIDHTPGIAVACGPRRICLHGIDCWFSHYCAFLSFKARERETSVRGIAR